MIDAGLAKRIRLVGMDVDGTLTDGGLYIGALDGRRVELKRFDALDGMAMHLLRMAGLTTAIVTGRASPAAEIRARELQVDDYAGDDGGGHKLPLFERILERHGVAARDAAFIGDDLADVPILKRVGLPVAVANAVAEIKAQARFTTACDGGHGALREFVEAFLRARGCWDDTLRAYLTERGDDGAR